MIVVSSLRYFSRAFEKSPSLLYNLMLNSTSKYEFFHESKFSCNEYKIEIKMPSLSPTMTEGTIVKWLKKEGDSIEPGDVLCEIQTDKAVVGLETEEEGVLEKIMVPENTLNIQLGEIIAVIVGQGQLNEKPASLEPAKTIQLQPEIPKGDASCLVGPAVKRLLHEFNLNRRDITGSGPKNNLLKGDVLKFIRENHLKPVEVGAVQKPTKTAIASSSETYIDIPVSSLEADEARKLVQAKTSLPHGYMSAQCKMDNILSYIRKHFKGDVTLNEFIIKSAVAALRRVPKMYAVRQDGQLRSPASINISMTYFENGECQTSVIKDAGCLNVQSIYEGMRKNESEPAAFRISNYSSLCISDFAEVISPSDVATLTISGIQSAFEEGLSVRKMRVTLSFDNYAVGETEAGEFLETFKSCLENPLTLMC